MTVSLFIDNWCIQRMRFICPHLNFSYHFTWKGPILVMKVNSSDGQVADCTEMDLEDICEIIKMYVPTYFHMLIA